MGWKEDVTPGPDQFNFREQPNKFGYLNNPDWTKDLDAVAFSEAVGNVINSTDRHLPCGHWHKVGIQFISRPNLYGAGWNDRSQLGIPIGSNTFDSVNSSAWSQVDCGYHHTALLRSDGTLWVIGLNQNGQLGLGDNTNRYLLTQVGTGTDWAFVACGHYRTYAIKTDGTMWAAGQNDDGQLGQGNKTELNTLTQVGVATDWASVASGNHQAMAIKTDGTLWGAGANAYGLIGLGSGDTSDRTTFTDTGVTGCAQVSCGQWHSGVIKTDGTMWMTGDGRSGEHGDDLSQLVYVFTQIGVATDWDEVCCSEYFSVSLKTDGTIYGTGDNSSGQLGQGDYTPLTAWTQIGVATNWTDIDCGITRTMAVNSSNELWGCGLNYNGQIGTGGYGYETSLAQSVGSGYTSVACGTAHSMAITTPVGLFYSGISDYGQAGIGDYTQIETLTLLSTDVWKAIDSWANHTVGLKADGRPWGVGTNTQGQLGQGFVSDVLYEFTQMSGMSCIQAVTGEAHTLVLASGKIYGTGYNLFGQLGLNDKTRRLTLTPVVSSVDNDYDENQWVYIAAGNSTSFGIQSNGTMWGCGRNSGGGAGMLGLGDTVDRQEFERTWGAPLGTDSDCSGGTLTMGADWTHDVGNAEYDADESSAALKDPGILIDGKTYRIAVTVANYDQGFVQVDISGDYGLGTPITSNGTYVEYLIADSTDLEFVTGAFKGSIQEYDVRELPLNWKQCSIGS
jgi:alpha-tubulin suppressor-like RCC1 family protein